MTSLFLNFASIYISFKKLDLAEEYLRKAKKTHGSQSVLGQIHINALTMHLYAVGERYDEALALGDTLSQRALAEHDFRSARAYLTNSATVAYHAAYYKKAYDIQTQVIALQDTINNIEISAKIDELHTVYEVDKITAEKERAWIYLISAIIGCVLLIIILVIWIFYSRRLKEKNRCLYAQIEAQSKINEQFRQRKLESESDNPLFVKAELWLEKERLYLNCNFSRDEMIAHLNSNEVYVSTAIKEATGQTIQEYINDKRLQYSVKMLQKNTLDTIENISIESGFASSRNFYRLFREQYGMTPSEFRKIAHLQLVS